MIAHSKHDVCCRHTLVCTLEVPTVGFFFLEKNYLYQISTRLTHFYSTKETNCGVSGDKNNIIADIIFTVVVAAAVVVVVPVERFRRAPLLISVIFYSSNYLNPAFLLHDNYPNNMSYMSWNAETSRRNDRFACCTKAGRPANSFTSPYLLIVLSSSPSYCVHLGYCTIISSKQPLRWPSQKYESKFLELHHL